MMQAASIPFAIVFALDEVLIKKGHITRDPGHDIDSQDDGNTISMPFSVIRSPNHKHCGTAVKLATTTTPLRKFIFGSYPDVRSDCHGNRLKQSKTNRYITCDLLPLFSSFFSSRCISSSAGMAVVRHHVHFAACRVQASCIAIPALEECSVTEKKEEKEHMITLCNGLNSCSVWSVAMASVRTSRV